MSGLYHDDFLVELVSHTPKGQGDTYVGLSTYFGLGYSKSDYLSRSSYSLNGRCYMSPREATNLINWSLRIVGDGGPTRVLYYDDAYTDTYSASPGFSYINAFKAPSYPFDLRLVQLYAWHNMMETRDRFFTVKIIDGTAGQAIWKKDVSWSEIAFSATKTGSWTGIDTGGVMCGHDFLVEMTPNNDNDGSIWLGCDTTAKNRNSDMSSGGIVTVWKDWTYSTGSKVNSCTRDNTRWMIRVGGLAR